MVELADKPKPCPGCGLVPKRSNTLIPDVSVLFCRGCRQFCIEGTPDWIKGGQNVVGRLLEARNERELRESPIEDPRWTQIGW